MHQSTKEFLLGNNCPWKTILFLTAMTSLSCVGHRIRTLKTPEVTEFPKEAIMFDLQVPYWHTADVQASTGVDRMRFEIIRFLSSKLIRHRVELLEPYTFVITAYEVEPFHEGERRKRQTSYSVRISQNGLCVRVALAWIVKSQGIREEEWQSLDSDFEYRPSFLGEFVSFLNGFKCPS